MKAIAVHPRVRSKGLPRWAFTLSELVVAVAILALMMLLAGQVFTITVKSTGQATALSTVNQRLRALEQALRDDLRFVSPQNSILAIHGRPVNAYWNRAGKESGSPVDSYPHLPDPEREDAAGNLVAPRADILAFFTARSAISATYPGAASSSQFVVYTHTHPVDYKVDASMQKGYRQIGWDPAKDQYPLWQSTATSTVPASDWHLARRAMLLTPSQQAPSRDINYRDPIDADESIRWRRWDPVSNLGLVDPIDAFDNPPDDPDHYALLNGFADILYNFDYSRELLQNFVPQPLRTGDYLFPDGNTRRVMGWDYLFSWFELPSQGRSTLDSTLPGALAELGGLAGYMLPRCCSFKVEWTFADQESLTGFTYPDGVLRSGDHVVWLDSWMHDDRDDTKDVSLFRTLLNEEQYYREKKDNNRANAFRELHDALWDDGSGCIPLTRARFSLDSSDPDAGTYVGMFWFPSTESIDSCTRQPTGTPAPDPFFPTAVRITVDVVDDLGRLDRPVRHVMVIPVGG